jgi:hypothetical protein
MNELQFSGRVELGNHDLAELKVNGEEQHYLPAYQAMIAQRPGLRQANAEDEKELQKTSDNIGSAAVKPGLETALKALKAMGFKGVKGEIRCAFTRDVVRGGRIIVTSTLKFEDSSYSSKSVETTLPITRDQELVFKRLIAREEALRALEIEIAWWSNWYANPEKRLKKAHHALVARQLKGTPLGREFLDDLAIVEKNLPARPEF